VVVEDDERGEWRGWEAGINYPKFSTWAVFARILLVFSNVGIEAHIFCRKRGRIAAKEPEPRGKTRITIRLDEDLLDYFLKEAEASGGAVGYQTLINEALRQHVEGKAPKLEDTLRRIVREEMREAS
jgi:uncharacterized protein (DUF4415 family)